MELKDVILSTLAEIEELTHLPEPAEEKVELKEIYPSANEKIDPEKSSLTPSARDDETRMLEGIRERLLVLFEGFQSPNNVAIEAKVDLTLNFLEYLLATIDNRLDSIKE